jgi:hypothetical protein
VTIPAGSTTATFAVVVKGDTLHEVDETFGVHLTAPVDATIGNADATGTIIDDDPVPAVSIGDASVPGGAAGTTTNALFPVTLSAVSFRSRTADAISAADIPSRLAVMAGSGCKDTGRLGFI